MVEELEEGLEGFGGAGDGSVDAFFGDKDDAHDAVVQAGLFEPGLDFFVVRKVDEPVEGDDLNAQALKVPLLPPVMREQVA